MNINYFTKLSREYKFSVNVTYLTCIQFTFKSDYTFSIFNENSTKPKHGKTHE